MKKIIKRIRIDIFDKITIAKFSQNKTQYNALKQQYKNEMFDELEIDVPDDVIIQSPEEIPYIEALLDKGLVEYDEYIYAGVEHGNMFEFDFLDKTVSISVNIMNNYVFFPEYKRAWFSSNVFKNVYLYANYETGEILQYIGLDYIKEQFIKEFKIQDAIKEILYCSEANSLEDLFKFYIV